MKNKHASVDDPSPAPPRWWRSLDERAAPEAFRARNADEFPEELPAGAGVVVGDAPGGTRMTLVNPALTAASYRARCSL